jgi:hypothetical protein
MVRVYLHNPFIYVSASHLNKTCGRANTTSAVRCVHLPAIAAAASKDKRLISQSGLRDLIIHSHDAAAAAQQHTPQIATAAIKLNVRRG